MRGDDDDDISAVVNYPVGIQYTVVPFNVLYIHYKAVGPWLQICILSNRSQDSKNTRSNKTLPMGNNAFLFKRPVQRLHADIRSFHT